MRLIGEDLELRPPRYVPLEIHVVVCAGEAYWREDLRFVLEQEFSDGWTSDGRRGFFHPDEWTFGQALHRSAIEGRIHRVTGIEHVVRIAMKRFSAPLPGVPGAEVLEMALRRGRAARQRSRPPGARARSASTCRAGGGE